MAHEKLTVGSGTQVLTRAIYDSRLVNRAIMTVEAASIRYWFDGSTPASDTGLLAASGAVITLNSKASIANFKATRVSGDAVIQVQYTNRD